MKHSALYGDRAAMALDVWIKLSRAFSTVQRLTTKHVAKHDLTLPQFAVLEALSHLGPLTIGDLCRKMMVSGGNMTVVLDNLQKSGLVKRVRSKEDRRTIVVELTEHGEERVHGIFHEHAEHVSHLFSVLSHEEQSTLGGLLRKLGLELEAGV